MNEEMMLFNDTVNVLRDRKYYVPRDYQTIGGMWTTDTYKHNGVTLQVMSEGYELRILSEGLDIIKTTTNFSEELTFKKGSKSNLEEVFDLVIGTTE